jgi:glycosyltransferase involved in cell wall biosynthesis
MSEPTKELLKDIWYYGDDFSRVSTVRHPHYIGAYGKKRGISSLNNETLKLLFFGQVRPYKGIEKLLEATEGMSDVEVSIFGKPKDDGYVAKLKSLCANRSNVTFRLEHIPDKDIPLIFAKHHLVALPYSIESSLNSGAAMLALSYGRTIVGTNNGTLTELGNSQVYFGYDYKNELDHVQQLKSAIHSIHVKYKGRYDDLLAIGDDALKLVEKENSIETVAKSIEAMINRIQ